MSCVVAALTPQPISPLPRVQRPWLGLHAMEDRGGAPRRQPPRARRLSPWRGDGGLRGRSTLSSTVGLRFSYPSFPPRFSPLRLSQPSRVSQTQLLARVPTSHPARRAGGTLKKGLLAQSSLRFADQSPPSPGAASLGSRSPEEQPFARPTPSLLLGGEGGSRAPSVPGREREKRRPRSPAPWPAPRPPPALRLYDTFTTNPVPMVASSWKHFRPVTFILKTNKHR